MKHDTTALVIVFVVLPTLGLGQEPVGPELQVDTFTTLAQGPPAVASDAIGNFVVAWAGYTPVSLDRVGIFGRRYHGSGAPLDAVEFRIDSYATGGDPAMHAPKVAMAGNGAFVVVWDSVGEDGDSAGIFARLFEAGGAPVGPEFLVNTFTTGWQMSPAVASGPSGNFVVVWMSYGQAGIGVDIFGQRFDASGARRGAEFQANAYSTQNTDAPAIAMDAGGNFVVAWVSPDPPGPGRLSAQRYDASGNRLGAELDVNTHTAYDPWAPRIASAADGRFVIVWNRQDGYGSGIAARRYDPSGAPEGDEFTVNAFTMSSEVHPAVSADPHGNFVVAWEVLVLDPPQAPTTDVFARRFDSSGVPHGLDFRVNTFTTSDQRSVAVASSPSGRFLVVWDSYQQNGPGDGVFGQRFEPDLIFTDGFD